MIELTGAIYARRSASRDSLSTDNQVERCQWYIPRIEGRLSSRHGQGVHIIIPKEFIFIDKGESGQDFDRSAYYRLRETIAARKIDILFIYDIDRLGRTEDITDMFIERRHCIQHDVSVWSEADDLEVTATDDVALFRFFIGGWRARKELEDIKRRTKQGRWTNWRHDKERASFGGRPRYGLTLDDDKHFTIDEEQASVIRQMFHWLTREGLSGEEIADRLEQTGIMTPSGRGRWWAHTVRRILGNAMLYAGAGFEYRILDDDTGETHAITIPTPEIIKLRDAQVALRVLDQQSKPKYTRNVYLLTGILHCDLCGSHFTGASNGRYTYYKCAGRSGPEPCQMSIVPRDAIEVPVWDSVARVVSNPQMLTDAMSEGTDTERVAAGIQAIEKEIEIQRKAQGRLAMNWAQARIPNDALESSLKKIRKRIEQLETELRQLEWQRLVLSKHEIDLLEDIRVIDLDRLPTSAKVALIQRLVNRVEVRPRGRRGIEATVCYYRLDAILGATGQNSRDLSVWTISTPLPVIRW